MINNCRKFIPKLSILKPLYELLKSTYSNKELIVKLNSKEIDDVYTNVGKSISEHTMLAIPDRTKQFILTTDASNFGIGAVLSQIQGKKEKAIAFYSSVHNQAQSKYSKTDKELLAIISEVKYFCYYLLGQKFLLRTDHKALIFMIKTKDEKTRIYRWSSLLQESDFILEHIKGINNYTDYLSRACNLEVTDLGFNSVKEIEEDDDKLKLVKIYHVETGHGNVETMLYLLKQKYNLKKMGNMCKDLIRKCEICEKDKKGKR